MLSFVKFNEKVETRDQYFERMALLLDAIRTGKVYEGMILQEVYTAEALSAMENYVLEQMYPIVKKVARCVAIENGIFYIADDYVSEVVVNVIENAHKYNNPSYRVKDKDEAFKKTTFGNFIRFCSKEPLRMILQQETGYTKRLSLIYRKIAKTKAYIKTVTGAADADITPEIIEIYMPEVAGQPLSAEEIRKALLYKKVYVSMDAVDEENNELIDETNYYEIADEKVDQFLRNWIEKLNPRRQMIFLQGCKFCPDVYCDMSIKEFGCDDCFIKACRMDAIGRKNILHGNPGIKKTNETDDKQMLVASVDYVCEIHISRVRVFLIEELAKYINRYHVKEDELRNQMERFFTGYWNELMALINENDDSNC